MQNTFFTLLLILLFGKESSTEPKTYALHPHFNNIETVKVDTHDSHTLLAIQLSQVDSICKSWNAMACELVIWHLQQLEALPLQEEKPLSCFLMAPGEKDTLHDLKNFLTIPNLANFALTPEYHALYLFTVDLPPIALARFERALSTTGLATDKEIANGFYQKLLLRISSAQAGSDNQSLLEALEKIQVYYQTKQPDWSAALPNQLLTCMKQSIQTEYFEVREPEK